MKKLVALLAVALVAVAAAPSAQAVPINSISFSGAIAPIPAASGWGAAQGLDFGSASVTDSQGKLAGVSVGTAAPHTDFIFNPSLAPNPVNPLWTAGGYSFVLESVTIVLQNSAFLVLEGKGKLYGPDINGFADADWAFSAQVLGGAFSFSSSNSFPEPATLALLGLGLFGSAGLTRRLRRR